MAVKHNLKPIIASMKADAKYKRLKINFDTLAVYQIAVDTMVKEVEDMHKIRDIRRLNTSDPNFVDKLIKANTVDQSTRGRMSEIMMTCLKATQTLDAACHALRQHLLMSYSDELRSFRTKDERTYIVDMALSPFIRYVNKVQMLHDLAQLVIKDIDQGNWSIRLSVQALQIDRKKESFL